MVIIESLAILLALAGVAAFVLAARGTRATLNQRERQAREEGREVYASIGGGRVGSINAIAPLAGLVATASEIDLILFGQDHVVERSEITRMSRSRDSFSTCILIEHKSPNQLEYLVFRAPNFKRTRDALVSLGYSFEH